MQDVEINGGSGVAEDDGALGPETERRAVPLVGLRVEFLVLSNGFTATDTVSLENAVVMTLATYA